MQFREPRAGWVAFLWLWALFFGAGELTRVDAIVDRCNRADAASEPDRPGEVPDDLDR